MRQTKATFENAQNFAKTCTEIIGGEAASSQIVHH
jgi:hypothetical protein